MTWSRRSTLACLALSSLFLLSACRQRAAEIPEAGGLGAEARLARIAEKLQRPLVIEGESTEHWNIEGRMSQFSVPGVSVAIIDHGQPGAADAG